MEIVGTLINFFLWIFMIYFMLYRQRKRYEKIITGIQADITRREFEIDLKMKKINERDRTKEGNI